MGGTKIWPESLGKFEPSSSSSYHPFDAASYILSLSLSLSQPSHPEQNETTKWLYDHLASFHNSKKVISLPNLIKHFNCGDGIDFLSASSQVLLPFDHAEFLLSIVKTIYLSVDDFWGAKVLVSTAYLIYQSKLTNAKEIFSIVKECFKTDGEIDEDRLANELPFCFEGYKAVESVESMKSLEQLDLPKLKEEVSTAESTVTLVVKDGNTQTDMTFNSLINLNTLLNLSIGKKQKIIRLKHNGSRVFLSSAGRKTLRQLGMADNDVLEIEYSIDTVLKPSDADNSKVSTAATSNRRKKKNKKKSKKNKSH